MKKHDEILSEFREKFRPCELSIQFGNTFSIFAPVRRNTIIKEDGKRVFDPDCVGVVALISENVHAFWERKCFDLLNRGMIICKERKEDGLFVVSIEVPRGDNSIDEELILLNKIAAILLRHEVDKNDAPVPDERLESNLTAIQSMIYKRCIYELHGNIRIGLWLSELMESNVKDFYDPSVTIDALRSEIEEKKRAILRNLVTVKQKRLYDAMAEQQRKLVFGLQNGLSSEQDMKEKVDSLKKEIENKKIEQNILSKKIEELEAAISLKMNLGDNVESEPRSVDAMQGQLRKPSIGDAGLSESSASRNLSVEKKFKR